jgi:hypothetical protein
MEPLPNTHRVRTRLLHHISRTASMTGRSLANGGHGTKYYQSMAALFCRTGHSEYPGAAHFPHSERSSLPWRRRRRQAAVASIFC